MTLKLYYTQKTKLEKLAKKETDSTQEKRYRIILCRHRGLSYGAIQQVLGSAPSTITRVLQRFIEEGIAGLRDRRQEREAVKVTEAYVDRLAALIGESPQALGWQRSTWTRELLAQQLAHESGIDCHPTHVGRLLWTLNIRWGRPKAASKASANPHGDAVKLGKIKALIANLDDDEMVIFEDEVDIHLNPKIGPCWMVCGEQIQVPTPGQNKKRYIYGGLNPKTGNVVWTESASKNSEGFIIWLQELARRYRRYTTLHVILDNYIIHKTKKVRAELRKLGRIQLHFLPPYSPEHNPIERLWGELHANVTRNHTHPTMDHLMAAVHQFMENAIPYPGARPSLAA